MIDDKEYINQLKNEVSKWTIEGLDETDDKIKILFLDDQVFFNSRWHEEKELPHKYKKYSKYAVMFVNCSDVFAWGFADAQDIYYDEIDDLYQQYSLNAEYGSSVWSIKKRGMMPQKPMYDQIMSLNIWNLDDMGLKDNPLWSKK